MSIESVVTFLVILGVLVLFHEWGHFTAARLVGIRVEEFAFGFGPKLLRLFKRGDTEYTLHPFPLGGFVKLAGMEPGQEDIPDGYQAQSAWKRAFVIFSGPFMSFVLGAMVFVLMGVYWGFPNPLEPQNQVGQVNPGTEAARIGLRAGDRVLKIDGRPIKRGLDMISLIHDKPGQPVHLLVQRDHKTLEITGTPKWMVQFLGAGWSFMDGNRAQVGEDLIPDTPVAKLFQPGDVLLKFNGKTIRGGKDLVDAIAANDGRAVRLELLRSGKNRTVTADPAIRWVEYLGAKWVFPGSYLDSDGRISPNSPTKKLKLDYADQLVSINGKKIKTGEEMVDALAAAGEAPVTLTVRDTEGETRKVSAPGPGTAPKVGYYDAYGLLGFAPAPSLKRTTFVESVKGGILRTVSYVVQTTKSLTNRKSLQRDVGGPVLIAKTTESFVALGPYWVFFELGMLSLSLAFVNLLPIPLLDGGHLAIILVESIRRKRLTVQQMAAVQMVWLVIIGLLIITVVFSDIAKIAGGKVPQ